MGAARGVEPLLPLPGAVLSVTLRRLTPATHNKKPYELIVVVVRVAHPQWLLLTTCLSPGDRIRTCDPVIPNHARYQTALHPDNIGWRRLFSYPFISHTPAYPLSYWEVKIAHDTSFSRVQGCTDQMLANL